MRTLSNAMFGIALACCPPAFRREYGRAMRADFSLAYSEEHTVHGAFGAFAYACGASTDLFFTALREYAAMLFRDFIYAFRALRKTPSFSAVVVATLALAIGANAAVFSILHAVVLSPLPYADPERLVALDATLHGVPLSSTLPDYADTIHANATQFTSSGAFTTDVATLTGHGKPRSTSVSYITSGLFETLGIQPQLGRFATAAEARKGAAKTLVISDALWRTQFNADPATVGSIVRLDGAGYRIIGVTPADFQEPRLGRGFQAPDIYSVVPDDGAGTQYAQRGWHAFGVVARLAPGATIASARAGTAESSRRLAARYPADDSGLAVPVLSLTDSLVGNVRALLFAMFAAVGAVLLVACANVANLLLSRAASREREFSVRIAIGASRGRIIAQLLVETFVLAVAGGAIGIAIAYGVVAAFVAYHPANIPRADRVVVDALSIAYTLAVVVFCTLAAGLAPAFTSSQRDVAVALKSAGRGGDASRGARARNVLVASEIAVTLALVVAAGLVIRSFVALTAQPLGFDAANVRVLGDISFGDPRYDKPAALESYMTQTIEKVKAVPGVESAAWVFPAPFLPNNFGTAFTIRGRAVRRGFEPNATLSPAGADYFHVIRATMLAGRTFTNDDRAGSLPVAIVNEAFARKFFPGGDVLKQAVAPSISFDNSKIPDRPIVGVVADIRTSFTKVADPTIYVPARQMPLNLNFVIFRALPGTDPAAAVAAQVTALDPQLPVPKITVLSSQLSQSVAVQRLSVAALSALAFVALALSIAGVFAIVSYGVTQRTHEFGVRMALGADARQIVQMVIGGAMRLAFAGIAIGLLVAAAGTRFLTDELYDTQPLDPLTFGTVTLFVIAAALIAALVPARRATRVDPIVALRYE